MSQRIKGQETTVTVTGPAGIEEGLIDVQSFEAEFQRDILTEGYLGEVSNRKDDIFNGTRGRLEVHLETTEYFRFVERANARSKRRTPAGEVFNILTTLVFPNGERARATFEDVFFGPLPLRVPSRAEYVTATIDWEAEDGRFL